MFRLRGNARVPRPRLLLDWIALDGDGALPLYRQLYTQLRTAVISGRLEAGSLMPSSRLLAHELGVSRNTVLNAYDQLAAEGYLETNEASATKVSRLSMEASAGTAKSSAPPMPTPEVFDIETMPVDSPRWRALRGNTPSLDLPESVAFAPGVPAFDQFPTKTWARLIAQHVHRMQPDMADNDDHVGGYGPLREALTSYLRASRMVACQSDQVLVVSSARAGLDLICRVLADPRSTALVKSRATTQPRRPYRPPVSRSWPFLSTTKESGSILVSSVPPTPVWHTSRRRTSGRRA